MHVTTYNHEINHRLKLNVAVSWTFTRKVNHRPHQNVAVSSNVKDWDYCPNRALA